MKKQSKQSIVWSIALTILLALLYYIIFSFSGQDGEQSGGISYKVSEQCVEIVNTVAKKNWAQSMKQRLAVRFEYPIRKLAHFTEYACMGVLVYGLLLQWLQSGKLRGIVTVFWVFVSACGDEIHQMYVPGRDGDFTDVCLDTCGGIFGMLCLLFLIHIYTKHKMHQRGKCSGDLC